MQVFKFFPVVEEPLGLSVAFGHLKPDLSPCMYTKTLQTKIKLLANSGVKLDFSHYKVATL